jgi:osmotically-inducible protein OsmY
MRLATAFAAGAAVMYYLDPQTGRRRRALAHDKSVAATHDVKEFARSKRKQAADRARGAAARTRAQLANEIVEDDVLRERVRSKLGHLVDEPIEVEVMDGRVVLSGNLSKRLLDELNDVVSAMPGVVRVESRQTTPQSTEKTTTGRETQPRH